MKILFKGIGGSVGTGKIDFDDLQKKLAEKIHSTLLKTQETEYQTKPERNEVKIQNHWKMKI